MKFWLGFLIEVGLWIGGYLGRAVDHVDSRGRVK